MAEPEQLRIGMTCYPTHGGSGAVAVDLASALAARGHEVHVISYATPFRLTADTRVGFHLVDVPAYPLFKYPPYAMSLASKLAEVSAQHDLHVIHAHYALPHSVAAILAKDMTGRDDLHVVTTLHGTDITLVGSDPSYRPATSWAIKRSDRVTAVSDFLVEATHRHLCADCSIEVVPNFVDTDHYRPSGGGACCPGLVSQGEFLLVHISNFRPVKRVEDVVRIFAAVQKRLPARLVLVGDGPERPLAEQLCRRLGIEQRVHFTGLQPDPLPILQCGHAFLLPSDGESFGLSALEAMACGVPVVGAQAGGLPEVVRDGADGILAPVGDVETMAARLVALLQDGQELQRFRESARSRARERFDTQLVVPHYERIYRDALHAHG